MTIVRIFFSMIRDGTYVIIKLKQYMGTFCFFSKKAKKSITHGLYSHIMTM